MKPKFDWKKIKRIFSRRGGIDPAKHEQCARRDWQIVVVSFFVLLVLVLGGHYAFYLFARGTGPAGALAGTVPEKLDKKALDRAVAGFAEREEKFKEISTQASRLVDPSL